MAYVYFLLLYVTCFVGLTSSDTNVQEELKFLRNSFESKLTHLETRVNYLEHEVTSLRLETSKNISGSLTHAVREAGRSLFIGQMAREVVAFHVYQPHPTCATDGQVITYPAVEVNNGNGYHANDGIFTAPTSGLYLFSWTIFSEDEDWVETELVVDGRRKGYVSVDTTTTDITPGTGVVLTHVNAGEHVFVRRFAGGGCHLSRNGVRNSFTGILMA